MATKPKLKISFLERDLGMSHFLKEAAKLRKKPFVKVGITQKKGSRLRADGKKTVADVAAMHEFGGEDNRPPERSFLRSTTSKNQKKYDAHIEKLKDQIFDAGTGMTTERALAIIGQEVSADVKNTIRNNEAGLHGPTPLKEATIRRKNAGVIAKAKAHLSAAPSAKDFTAAGSRANEKASSLVETGGESTPLIDTGQMVNSISYEVAMDGNNAKGQGG